MARRKKRREVVRQASLGRVLAVLRTALDLTQDELAQLSGVKRSSISEYERGVRTPDASTLERLLSAMGFRWTALDFGSWFLDRLSIDRRVSEGDTAPPLATASFLAARLSADVITASQTAARLSMLVLALQEEQRKEYPSLATGNPGALARDRTSERRAAQALWSRIKVLSQKEQVEALRGAPPEAQWAVCDLLCKESQRLCDEDPAKAATLCELALVAAWNSSPEASDQPASSPVAVPQVVGRLHARIAPGCPGSILAGYSGIFGSLVVSLEVYS